MAVLTRLPYLTVGLLDPITNHGRDYAPGHLEHHPLKVFRGIPASPLYRIAGLKRACNIT